MAFAGSAERENVETSYIADGVEQRDWDRDEDQDAGNAERCGAERGQERDMVSSFIEGCQDMRRGAGRRSGLRPWSGIGFVVVLEGGAVVRSRATHTSGRLPHWMTFAVPRNQPGREVEVN